MSRMTKIKNSRIRYWTNKLVAKQEDIVVLRAKWESQESLNLQEETKLMHLLSDVDHYIFRLKEAVDSPDNPPPPIQIKINNPFHQ